MPGSALGRHIMTLLRCLRSLASLPIMFPTQAAGHGCFGLCRMQRWLNTIWQKVHLVQLNLTYHVWKWMEKKGKGINLKSAQNKHGGATAITSPTKLVSGMNVQNWATGGHSGGNQLEPGVSDRSHPLTVGFRGFGHACYRYLSSYSSPPPPSFSSGSKTAPFTTRKLLTY